MEQQFRADICAPNLTRDSFNYFTSVESDLSFISSHVDTSAIGNAEVGSAELR